MLKARLFEHEMQKKEEENQKELTSKTDIGWGPPNKILCIATLSISKRLKK